MGALMMAAEPVRPLRLTLLVEPIAPDISNVIGPRPGWTFDVKQRTYVRNHADDDQGALYQHMIAWYALCGVRRQRLAQVYGYSERHTQAVLSGLTWVAYTRAMLAELASLGITPSKGHGVTNRRQALELAEARRCLLDEALALLAQGVRPVGAVEMLRRRAAILTVDWDGLR